MGYTAYNSLATLVRISDETMLRRNPDALRGMYERAKLECKGAVDTRGYDLHLFFQIEQILNISVRDRIGRPKKEI